MTADSRTLLVVAGPTASGKSSLAIRCAKALNGEVLAVDSVQVYRGFDVGSAKVTEAEREGVPHHLLDIRDGGDRFNVADYLREAEASIEAISARGCVPVLCGGTTQYITALLHGLVGAPEADVAFREGIESVSNALLHEQLCAIDPDAAERIHPHDRVRIIRALETHRQSGKKLSEMQHAHRFSEVRNRALMLVLCWSRAELYRRINERSKLIVEQGLISETKELLCRISESAPALRTLGYDQARRYLRGELSEQDLVSEIAQQTRRYAKRQMTFWRNEPQKRGWLVRPTADELGRELPVEAPAPGRPRRPQRSFRVLEWSWEQLLERIRETLPQLKRTEVWYIDASGIVG